MEDLGRRIREARQDRAWTLDELSARSGLSTGFLSEVERGQSSLSIVSLASICGALGVPIEGLLSSSGPLAAATSRVTRADEQLRIQIGDSPVSYRYLTSQLPGAPIDELLIAELPPDAQQEPQAHKGEELGYVLEGTLTLRAAGDEVSLSAGDSYRVRSSEIHDYRAGPAGAKVLMAVTQRFVDVARQRPTRRARLHGRAAVGEEDHGAN
ncbi:MAG: cupin domain-containing protein [Candidatus Bipolaricaulota bacterium]